VTYHTDQQPARPGRLGRGAVRARCSWSPRGGGLAWPAASSWVIRCGGTSRDSSHRKRGRCQARRNRRGRTDGGGATTEWRGRLGMAAFRWRAAPTIVNEFGEVLQLEGNKGVRKWWLMEETRGSRRRSPMNGGRRRGSGGIPCGQCPPVVGNGQEVGRGVGRARAAGKEERKWGKGGAAMATATVLTRRRLF
jgi:hypothetical protein